MTTPMSYGPVPGSTDEPPVWQPPALATDASGAPPHDPTVPGPTGPGPVVDAPAASAFGLPEAARRGPAAIGAPRRATSTTVLLLAATMIAIAGVSFATGRVTATGQTGTGSTNFARTGGVPGQNGIPGVGALPSGAPALGFGRGEDGGAFGSATVTGTVVSVTSTSITIQLTDGRTETIAIGSSTSYYTQAAASSGAVTTGSKVIVQTGSTGSTAGGTRTATSVTVTSK
jgi:hypothetical protein